MLGKYILKPPVKVGYALSFSSYERHHVDLDLQFKLEIVRNIDIVFFNRVEGRKEEEGTVIETH